MVQRLRITIMSSFTIGQVAKRARVSIDTVRYYERSQLLPEPERRASGYRQYVPDDVDRLRFIRRAKTLGFSLEEIKDLLTLSTDRERGVKGVKARAESRLAELASRIAEMQRIHYGLKALIDACPGRGTLEACPILTALATEETS